MSLTNFFAWLFHRPDEREGEICRHPDTYRHVLPNGGMGWLTPEMEFEICTTCGTSIETTQLESSLVNHSGRDLAPRIRRGRRWKPLNIDA